MTETATVHLKPSGALVAHAAADFAAVARRAAGCSPRQLLVDLGEVTILDRRALDALLDVASQVRGRGGSLALVAPNGLCADILRRTQVDQTIPVVRSFAEVA